MPCSSAELLQTEATEPDQVFRIGYIHFLTTTSFISTFVFSGRSPMFRRYFKLAKLCRSSTVYRPAKDVADSWIGTYASGKGHDYVFRFPR